MSTQNYGASGDSVVNALNQRPDTQGAYRTPADQYVAPVSQGRTGVVTVGEEGIDVSGLDPEHAKSVQKTVESALTE